MMFCPRCGSMLRSQTISEKKVLGCSCGYVSETNLQFKSEVVKSEEIQVVHDEEPDLRTVVDDVCPKCGHTKAYHWTQQVGPSDEPEDNLFRCTKCGHGWRDKY